ncbi:coiled-coil domain-containing protein 170-like isoform X1 [Ruditapes philippinarum]|uniref:coiled-coil domain-containing protein 170-like isoform X1 n=1 Tax=Ruditapes philippinarum TaxID=129788 RepID=UPI00295AA8F4|nr:coiled-coil domain-containing protein 170-like isoform X1 [Ruditapes philippinarum]
MASYLKELEREGALPAIRTTSGTFESSRRVNFEDDRYTRSRSPTSGVYGHRSESPMFQPRPPSPGAAGRRSAQELQDQVKVFREEIQKKDALIQQLSSMESVTKVPVRSQADSIRLEHIYMGDRQSLDAARSELAALQVRTEKQENKIRELDNELEIRDVRIKELQLQMETGRENERRLQSLVESLRSQVVDLEGRAGAIESVASRSEVTVSALQKENKASNERIVELESRQRKLLEEREEAQARAELLDRRFREHFAQFASILKFESISGGVPTPEEIIRQISAQAEENAMLKGKLLTLTETLNNSELETKASRETIMRLVSEMGKEQQTQSKYASELDHLRSRSRDRYRSYDVTEPRPMRSCLKSPTHHRDRSLSRERDRERGVRKDYEMEIGMLKERLEASQRTIDAQRNELDMRDGRLNSLEQELRSHTTKIHSTSSQHVYFRDQLIKILGDIDSHCDDEYIRRRIENLLFSNRDLRNKNEDLEIRLKELTEQLETQYGLHKSAAARARKAEADAAEFQQRLQSAEGELVAGDVMRDGFRSDKESYMRCLQRLGEAMKMDRISIDLGMDMTIDALIARAEQLVKLERDALADRSTHIYNLQRKVKSLKEQLESKDLHIDLLRKKITSLEEKILGKSTIERERDSELLRIRKMEKLIEKYKIQLGDARQEITNLKAELLGSSELRVRTLEQRKETEELANQVQELEKLRRKQAHKIRELKMEIDSTTTSSQENRVVADNAVQALSSELKTTKTALSTIQQREKQLIDFRHVVARMLGLDINTLAIPDYEIISRLEKLISAHHSHTFTTLSLEEALADMEDGFFCGYRDHQHTMGETESHNIRKSRERVKRKALKARARSCSPTRRITPKCY